MKMDKRYQEENKGFTLVEVLISILILSVIISAAVAAFSQTAKHSRENKLSMTALNLANEAIEYIRSLEFAQVGTKIVVGGTTIYGDPAGDILQSRAKTVNNVEYTIKTTISWEEQGGWNLGDTDWDYKSVRVSVVPKGMESNPYLTKVIETYISRDSTQPPLTGANISLRIIRGWTNSPGEKIPVSNAKVKLSTGPGAPRQVQTSSAGVARFIGLSGGSYSVVVDISDLGMILYPDQESTWNIVDLHNDTATEEFKAEYPCMLRVVLKDLDGNPILMDPSAVGSIAITVPYGTPINKNFTADMIDTEGKLPFDYIKNLWPVGTGYAGAYTVSNVSLPECQYFGSFVSNGVHEELWDGKFDAPGTMKEIICYFGTIPVTPGDINTAWVDGGLNILTGAGSYTAMDAEDEYIYHGKFATGSIEETIIMEFNTSADYYATGMYFENKGTASDPGLYIKNRSNLVLHTGLIVFRGEVEFQHPSDPSDIGCITLDTTYEDGASAAYIDGSLIGGAAGVMYGKLYLAKPIRKDGPVILESGGYYYYDGLKLPGNAAQLIPITKANYLP